MAGEARKGYDLLVVGIANTRDPHDGFSKDLSVLTQGFAPHPVAVAGHATERAGCTQGYCGFGRALRGRPAQHHPRRYSPDQAILHEAARGYDLVVLGVSRRAGDVLFFGNTAAAVLERSPTSNLFVAS